jgi:MGT family glycosyltransferase
MANIAFVVPAYRGHVAPTKALAIELQSRGHQVYYYATANNEDLLKEIGLSYTIYPNTKSLKTLVSTGLPGDVSQSFLSSLMESYTLAVNTVNNTVNVAHDVVPWLTKEFTSKNIDLVFYGSMSFWGEVAANELKIPSICFTGMMAINSNTIWYTWENLKYKIIPSFIYKPLYELKSLYKSDVSTLLDMVSCDHSKHAVLFTSKALQRHSEHFPESKYIFFPKTCDIDTISNEHLISSNSSLNIFASFGTLFNTNINGFKSIIDTFGAMNHNVVLSIGGRKEVYDKLVSYNHHPNVDLRLFVNQNEILKNTDVFVTHAGFNGVKEAICNLVPMITTPIDHDQPFIAKTLIERGVAHLLDLKSPLKPQLEYALSEIKDHWEIYQDKLKSIRDTIIDESITQNALDKIEKIIGESSDHSHHDNEL